MNSTTENAEVSGHGRTLLLGLRGKFFRSPRKRATFFWHRIIEDNWPARPPQFVNLLRIAWLKDVALAVSAVYFSIWLYEIGNLVALTLVGAKASLTMAGILPGGVIATSSDGVGPFFAKLLQVGICVSVALLAFAAARERHVPISSLTLVGVTGMFISSMYWEMLSLTSFIPMAVHEVIFGVLTLLAITGLSRVFLPVPAAEISQLLRKSNGSSRF